MRVGATLVLPALAVDPKVKNKAWFGMNWAFRELTTEWTVQEEAANAMMWAKGKVTC